MNKNIVIGGAAGVILIGCSFYGGMLYGEHAGSAARGQFGAGMYSGSGFGRTGSTRGAFGAGGVVSGQILSKDASSITVKTPDGSSKIVLMSGSTSVMKSATGSAADLSVGTEVSVIGSANSDGSISANTVSIRPASTTLIRAN